MTNEMIVKDLRNKFKQLESCSKYELESVEENEEESPYAESTEIGADSDCYVFLVKDKRKEDTSCSIFCRLIRSDWYWGSLRRSEAEAIVLKHPGHFIIRDSCDLNNILCITFIVNPDPNLLSFSLDLDSVYNSPGEIVHVNIRHHKEMFSLDRKEYVPVEDLAEHCARIGRNYNIFNARPLQRNAFRRALLKKKICNWH